MIVLELKRPGKNLDLAMTQGIGYAESLKAPFVIVTDGVFVKTYSMKYEEELRINDEIVEELISEKIVLEFLRFDTTNLKTRSQKVISSRSELINIFEEANNLLRREGIQAGLPRFSEFINILFLKLISELAELDEQPHNTIPNEYRWDYFKNFNGKVLLNYINDTVLTYYQNKYNEDSLFNKLTITNSKTLEEIIEKLERLSLVDINADIKGDAFEHFLKSYATGENDLGQYFTPRHIVKFMVKMLNPNFGETIYDPFCGTGGILIETYKHIRKGISNNEKLLSTLNTETVFGSEITNTARITKMNMILMGDGHSNIKRENSLQNINEDIYDIIITNPPFAQKTEYGSMYPVPSDNGNSICLQKSILTTKTGGRGAVIVQKGVLFDKKYMLVRKWLFNNAKIKMVVSLPNGVFLPYTNAKTSIIFYEEKGTASTSEDNTTFINVKNDGFTLGNQREEIKGKSDLEKILEYRTDFEDDYYSQVEDLEFLSVNFEKIENMDYQLISSKYTEKKELTSQYDLKPIKELCTVIRRGPFGSAVKKSLYVDEGIKVYTQGNVINKDFEDGTYYITEDYFNEKLQKFEIFSEDILMTCAGTLGKIALVPDDIEKGIINSVLAIFRVNKQLVLPKYFYILMTSSFIQEELLNAVGTGVKNMRPLKEIGNLKVPVPTMEEQKQIIEKHERLEQEIEEQKELLKKLKNDLYNFEVL